MKYGHEVIFCVVNAGFSDAVMDAARKFGAGGGTVINARGTANPEAENLFQITVQPEKEIVMILVKSELKDDILHALYKEVGLDTPGQGIAFTMPVSATVGLSDRPQAKQTKDQKTENAEKPADNDEAKASEEKK